MVGVRGGDGAMLKRVVTVCENALKVRLCAREAWGKDPKRETCVSFVKVVLGFGSGTLQTVCKGLALSKECFYEGKWFW